MVLFEVGLRGATFFRFAVLGADDGLALDVCLFATGVDFSEDDDFNGGKCRDFVGACGA